MGQTLENGIYLPSEGERNCYDGLASNWTALDSVVGGYSAHVANTTIHVTAEDKAKWDAVTGKADDTDVVHKSGTETIPGVKVFSSTPYIYNSDVTASTPNFNLRNSKVTKGTTTDNGSQIIQFLDKDLKYLAQLIGNKLSNGSSAIKFNVSTLDSNAQSVNAEVQLYIAVNGDKRFIPSNDNDVALGRPQNRWKDINTYLINGINPGALFLPQDRSARVDISAYFTNTASGESNQMTVPADGWIYLALDNVVIINLACNTSGGLTNYADSRSRASVGSLLVTFPVRKNDVFKTTWYTTSAAVTVSSAFFIPCNGNV